MNEEFFTQNIVTNVVVANGRSQQVKPLQNPVSFCFEFNENLICKQEFSCSEKKIKIFFMNKNSDNILFELEVFFINEKIKNNNVSDILLPISTPRGIVCNCFTTGDFTIKKNTEEDEVTLKEDKLIKIEDFYEDLVFKIQKEGTCKMIDFLMYRDYTWSKKVFEYNKNQKEKLKHNNHNFRKSK
jgi:hypothetical protein